MLDTGAGRDDVDDRVHGANLVEMDVLDRDVVDFGFGVTQQIEGANGALLDGCGKSGGLDQIANLRQRAAVYMRSVGRMLVRVFVVCFVCMLVAVLSFLVLMLSVFMVMFVLFMLVVMRVRVRFFRMRVLMRVFVRVFMLMGLRMSFGQLAVFQHVHFGRSNPTAIDGFNAKRGVEIERGDYLVKNSLRNAGVEKRAEEHIAGDAGEAVEVSNAHASSLSVFSSWNSVCRRQDR